VRGRSAFLGRECDARGAVEELTLGTGLSTRSNSQAELDFMESSGIIIPYLNGCARVPLWGPDSFGPALRAGQTSAHQEGVKQGSQKQSRRLSMVRRDEADGDHRYAQPRIVSWLVSGPAPSRSIGKDMDEASSGTCSGESQISGHLHTVGVTSFGSRMFNTTGVLAPFDFEVLLWLSFFPPPPPPLPSSLAPISDSEILLCFSIDVGLLSKASLRDHPPPCHIGHVAPGPRI
jgi:hypothetical protein